MTRETAIEERWRAALQSIQKVQQQSLAASEEVVLVAVSKGHSAEQAKVLLEAGQKIFGENRVQEAAEKWPALRAQYPHMRLHLIGSLQTNKVKEALALFDVIETIDRAALVDAIVKVISEQRSVIKTQKFFVQVNTGEEPQKGGVLPHELKELLAYIRSLTTDHRPLITICGLMCIPPEGKNPAPHFALLAQLAREHGLKHLSMGMSSDYEIAVRLGATHVRLGTALFGERKG